MQLRVALLAVTATFAALSRAQDMSQPITYSAAAQPIHAALAEIGKQASVKLFVQTELADEPIIIRFKAVPLKEAMDRIASTIGAEWIKKPDGYDLIRTPKVEDQLNADELKSKEAGFLADLKASTKNIELDSPMPQPDIDRLAQQFATMHSPSNNVDSNENWRAVVQFQHSLPDARATWKIVQRIDIAKLATLSQGDRVVFSNKPTHAELPIDSDLSGIAQELMDEHNRFVDAYTKLDKPKDSQHPYWGEMPLQLMKQVPDRFILAVDKELFSSSISVDMTACNAQNVPLTQSTVSIQIEDDYAVQAEHTRTARNSQSEPDIKTSTATKQILDIMRRANGGDPTAMSPVTGELRTTLLHPEDTDPLSFAVSDALLGVAEARNENMVAYPDDALFLIVMFAGQEGSLKPSTVLQAIQSPMGFGVSKVSEDNGWLEINPEYRLDTLTTRMNRAALGEYLRSYEQNGFYPIDDVAKMVRSVPGYQMPILGIYVPMFIAPELGSDVVPQGDISMWKFYAGLNEGEITALKLNAGLTPSSLTPAQLIPLEHFFYNSSESMRHAVPVQMNSESNQVLLREPCEALPDGFPADLKIGERDQVDLIYFANVTNGASSFNQAMNIDTMAYYLTDINRRPNGGMNARITSIEPGTKRTITIYISAPNQISSQGEISEERKTAGGPWTLATLPPDIKAKLDKAIQMRKNVNTQIGDNTPPAKAPPPAR